MLILLLSIIFYLSYGSDEKENKVSVLDKNSSVLKKKKVKNVTKNNTAKVLKLRANKRDIQCAENSLFSVSIVAILDDKNEINITKIAQYESDNTLVAEIKKGHGESFNNGTGQIKVTYGNKSVFLNIKVFETIEGHMLPDDPGDEADKTLLGIDKNNNGVRDDVEIWIYKNMPTYHHPKIERVIAMQKAKAYQMALKDPNNGSDMVFDSINKASYCWAHYSTVKDLPIDGAMKKFNTELKDRTFNTKERIQTYFDYDYTLKGRVLVLPKESGEYCNKNIDSL